MRAKSTGEPGWLWRRLFLFAVVIFACWRLVELEGGIDSRLNETIAWGWLMIISVMALGYTGLATAQDIAAIWATRSGLPYSPASSPIAADVAAASTVTTAVVVDKPAPTEPGSAPG